MTVSAKLRLSRLAVLLYPMQVDGRAGVGEDLRVFADCRLLMRLLRLPVHLPCCWICMASQWLLAAPPLVQAVVLRWPQSLALRIGRLLCLILLLRKSRRLVRCPFLGKPLESPLR